MQFHAADAIDTYLPTVTDRRITATVSWIHTLLQKLDLPGKMQKYTDTDTLTQHVDLMFHPDRIGNYALPADREQVLTILKRSMAI